ncbi:MOSC domain-containing protein [Hasllibacter halocynthiae]|uniref:MOSC domain-containing protein n=1 Tax=Hasllibacter halocynthiae TaxID=595589 RepID=A0A2T0X9T7_9RHOB|nr:MOSC domain-containing protein [Hasllibacter halocynthiae]PRY95634.1 MOSC domain-containing protein [Hasllibacter halocynthiae]
MPALIPTSFAARVRWLGVVPDREAALASAPRASLTLGFAGPEDEDHGGRTRLSCGRVVDQHPFGTEIANVRQLSVVSAEELAAMAEGMELDEVDPAWMGATMVVEGIPDFTKVPPSSRLQGPDGATLVVDMENRPCQLPARVIEGEHPGKGGAFKGAARGRRGVTAWVERPGTLALGDELVLHVPDQDPWPHLPAARGR